MKISDLLPVKGLGAGERRASGQACPPDRTMGRIDLKTGQILRARVVGHTADGKVLLDIGGTLVEARSEVALESGCVVWLEVKQGGAAPWLALAGKKGAVLEFLRAAPAGSTELAGTLEFLFSLDSAAAQQVLSPADRDAVGELVRLLAGTVIGRDGGPARVARGAAAGGEPARPAFREGLGALALALRSAAALSGLDKDGSAGLERLAAMVTAMHGLNSEAPSAGQAPFFLFPCFFAGAAGWGEWLFCAEQEGGTDREGKAGDRYGLTFFLEMSAVGAVHCRIAVRQRELDGLFTVSRESVRDHLDGGLSGLREILGRLGYGPVRLHAEVSGRSLLLALKDELEEKAGLRSVNIVNVTA